jgi:ribonuclease Z
MPDVRRVGACTFVIAGEHLFIVDSGPGSTINLELMQVPIEDADAVLLTHLHSDHIAGLGELLLKAWANGARTEPMRVLGPEGVERVVEGYNQAFGPDAEFRYAHHGDAVTPREGFGGKPEIIEGFGKDGSTVIFEADDLKVTAFLVDHRPVEPALGYHFDYRGRSVLISGDTLPSESLMRQSRDVDLLVHEAMDPEMLEDLKRAATASGEDVAAEVAHDIFTYHTFPEEAARIARDADAGALVLTHIIPPMPVSVLQPLFLGDSASIFDGPITVAFEGMLFSLPPHTDETRKNWLLK